MYTGPLMGFDTETTGVHVYDDGTRIVTCAMILENSPEEPPKVLEWVMDPEIEIPTGASDVHGITTEMARAQGMDYRAGLQQIADTLKYIIEQGIPTTAYNGSFDATLLRVEFRDRGIDFDEKLWDNLIMIDPLMMDKFIDKFRKGKRTLSVVSEIYGYDLSNAHDATADVLATIHVARRILNPFTKKFEKDTGDPVTGFPMLMQVQPVVYREQATSLEQYFRKTNPDTVVNKSWPFQDPEVVR